MNPRSSAEYNRVSAGVRTAFGMLRSATTIKTGIAGKYCDPYIARTKGPPMQATPTKIGSAPKRTYVEACEVILNRRFLSRPYWALCVAESAVANVWGMRMRRSATLKQTEKKAS